MLKGIQKRVYIHFSALFTLLSLKKRLIFSTFPLHENKVERFAILVDERQCNTDNVFVCTVKKQREQQTFQMFYRTTMNGMRCQDLLEWRDNFLKQNLLCIHSLAFIMLYKQSESQKFPTVKVKKESKKVGVLAGKASIFFSTGRSFLYQKHLKPESSRIRTF